MSQTATLTGKPWQVAVTRTFLGALQVLVIFVAILSLLYGISALVGDLSTGHTTLSLIADKNLPAISSGTTHIVTGSYATADVVVTGASASVVAFATISKIAGMLTQLALCGVLITLAWRLLRGHVFKKGLTFAMNLAGASLLLGGMITEGAAAIASGTAASELNESAHNSFWPLAATSDLTYIIVGLVLLLTGLAFEYGQRLQKDADGLV